MLNTRKDEGSTETTWCMTDGDPWSVFGFGFIVSDILIHVLHMYIIYYSGSVWMSIVTF